MKCRIQMSHKYIFFFFLCGPPIVGSHLLWSPSMICISLKQCYFITSNWCFWPLDHILSSSGYSLGTELIWTFFTIAVKISTPAGIWTLVSPTTIWRLRPLDYGTRFNVTQILVCSKLKNKFDNFFISPKISFLFFLIQKIICSPFHF